MTMLAAFMRMALLVCVVLSSEPSCTLVELPSTILTRPSCVATVAANNSAEVACLCPNGTAAAPQLNITIDTQHINAATFQYLSFRLNATAGSTIYWTLESKGEAPNTLSFAVPSASTILAKNASLSRVSLLSSLPLDALQTLNIATSVLPCGQSAQPDVGTTPDYESNVSNIRVAPRFTMTETSIATQLVYRVMVAAPLSTTTAPPSTQPTEGTTSMEPSTSATTAAGTTAAATTTAAGTTAAATTTAAGTTAAATTTAAGTVTSVPSTTSGGPPSTPVEESATGSTTGTPPHGGFLPYTENLPSSDEAHVPLPMACEPYMLKVETYGLLDDVTGPVCTEPPPVMLVYARAVPQAIAQVRLFNYGDALGVVWDVPNNGGCPVTHSRVQILGHDQQVISSVTLNTSDPGMIISNSGQGPLNPDYASVCVSAGNVVGLGEAQCEVIPAGPQPAPAGSHGHKLSKASIAAIALSSVAVVLGAAFVYRRRRAGYQRI